MKRVFIGLDLSEAQPQCGWPLLRGLCPHPTPMHPGPAERIVWENLCPAFTIQAVSPCSHPAFPHSLSSASSSLHPPSVFPASSDSLPVSSPSSLNLLSTSSLPWKPSSLTFSSAKASPAPFQSPFHSHTLELAFPKTPALLKA